MQLELGLCEHWSSIHFVVLALDALERVHELQNLLSQEIPFLLHDFAEGLQLLNL